MFDLIGENPFTIIQKVFNVKQANESDKMMQQAQLAKAQELERQILTNADAKIVLRSKNKNEVFGITQINGDVLWVGNVYSRLVQTGGSEIFDEIARISNLIQKKSLPAEQIKYDTEYYLDFAIAICNGPIDNVLSMYINTEATKLSAYDYTLYYGRDDEEVDHIITNENKDLYKNLAYIVFRRFPVWKFANRIPKFSFCVQNGVASKMQSSLSYLTKNCIRGVCMIPGTGEFVYSTQKYYQTYGSYRFGKFWPNGDVRNITNNAESERTDFEIAIANLKNELPNNEWVNLVSCWFCDNLNIKFANLYPAVEFEYPAEILPQDWVVCGINRQDARVVSKDSVGEKRYGGTPSDSCIIEGLEHMKKTGYKTCFSPFVMMDCDGKPWRGKMHGDVLDIETFGQKYRSFILHYANLCKGLVSAFCIGSELVGLTSIFDGDCYFPFVDFLCDLALECKSILGNSVKITYAADWSEYHHTNGGWYNLDKLWACPAIDFIGIDCYMPLTDLDSGIPSIDEVQKGFTSGEGWDFYYNYDRTEKYPLEAKYAWKNIRWFLENDHYNPDGQKTSFVPKSKKVWFMEYGFPSVDLCSNEPNVFFDSTSYLSGFPRKSSGSVDFSSQKRAIVATQNFVFDNSDIIKNSFLWCYDARPYPYFPFISNVWADSKNWKYGHWVNGKISSCSLGDLIVFIANRVGFVEEKIDVSQIDGDVSAFILSNYKTAKMALDSLMLAYNISFFEENGVLHFRYIDSKFLDSVVILDNEICYNTKTNETFSSYETQMKSIKNVKISYINTETFTVDFYNYVLDDVISGDEVEVAFHIAFSEENIKIIANQIANRIKMEKRVFRLKILSEKKIKVTDIVKMPNGREFFVTSTIKTSRDDSIELFLVEFKVLENFEKILTNDYSLGSFYNKVQKPILYTFLAPRITTYEIQNLNPFCYVSVVNCGGGGELFYSVDDGVNYSYLTNITKDGIAGFCNQRILDQRYGFCTDFASQIQIDFTSDVRAPQNGFAIVGNEIVYFNKSKIQDNCFIASELYRCRLGSFGEDHLDSEFFAVLSPEFSTLLNLPKSLFLKDVMFKFVRYSDGLESFSTINCKIINSYGGIYYNNISLEDGNLFARFFKVENFLTSGVLTADFDKNFSVNIDGFSTEVRGSNSLILTQEMLNSLL